MKKLLIQVLCLMTYLCSQAQFVNIPDSNFRKYLNAQYPQAMNGTTMDTSSPFITNATYMMLDSTFYSL